jgi:diguanylate cyclase (GGDEF)-like protein
MHSVLGRLLVLRGGPALLAGLSGCFFMLCLAWHQRLAGVVGLGLGALLALACARLRRLQGQNRDLQSALDARVVAVDPLTGLPLRDHFFTRLEQEDQRARRYGGNFAVLMVDLDGFKRINDRYGHLAGDQYLREFSAAIREQLRAADIACRYGGDEFCLLLPETGRGGARAIAERIRRAVAERSVLIDGESLRTTVSIGLALYPDHDGGHLRGLVHRADEALYRAKRSGRDRVVPFAA